MQNKIPTSKIARGSVVGKAMLKIGVSHSTGVVKRAFISKEKKELSQSQTHAQIAKMIIDSLGELKGVSVKIAQQVALGLLFYPRSIWMRLANRLDRTLLGYYAMFEKLEATIDTRFAKRLMRL